jgi:hypothetical protein
MRRISLSIVDPHPHLLASGDLLEMGNTKEVCCGVSTASLNTVMFNWNDILKKRDEEVIEQDQQHTVNDKDLNPCAASVIQRNDPTIVNWGNEHMTLSQLCIHVVTCSSPLLLLIGYSAHSSALPRLLAVFHACFSKHS